jgi:hypothetical protein
MLSRYREGVDGKRGLIRIMMMAVIIAGPLYVNAQNRIAENRFSACRNNTAYRPGLEYGIKFGPSFNQFGQPGTMIGFNFGLFGNYKINNCVAARVELLYSAQGGGRTDYRRVDIDPGDPFGGRSVSVTNVNPQIVFNNVEVPILAELCLAEFSKEMVRPKLLVGGSYSYMISAVEHKTSRYNFYDGTFADMSYTKQNVTSYYNKNQFSAIIGAGICFNLNNRKFHVDIRYRQGLTQLNARPFDIPGMGGKLHSSSLIFNMGFTL